MSALVNLDMQTMSSREIAELTGKEHRHVKRDCEVMLVELELSLEGYAQNWTHPQNSQTYVEYLLPRDLVETLITGYNIKLRHAVLNRLRELEDLAKQPVNLSNPQMLRAALLGYTEKVIELEHKVEILEPKAKALEVIASTTGTYNIRECAKAIGIGERKLVGLLLGKGWCYREESGRLQPYAEKVTAGIFINRPSPVITNRNTGEEKVHLHMRITAFGLTRITGLVNKLTVGVAA